ncbi:MAG: hypothetical protein RLZZ126_1852 [Pseudomonadota bacterium]|jgi:outer membrane lipase/esterase
MLLRFIRTTLATASLAAALALPMAAQAGPYSSIYVFGDSLSDTGNLALTSPGGVLPQFGGFQGPYYSGPFQQLSNGPVWVNHLAAGLGLPATQALPFLVGGNNYAFAGARTDASFSVPQFIPPGMHLQLGMWNFGGAAFGLSPTPAHAVADPAALYVVIGGGNDMRDARSAPGATQASIDVAADIAVANLAYTVGALANLGAKNVLISTLPDLGMTPEAIGEGLVTLSSAASAAFNARVAQILALEGVFAGLDVDLMDMAGALQPVVADPDSFGITNTTLPCAGFIGSAGTACSESIFSDILHPSARMHELIAQEALEALGIPEPESLALVALALLAVVATTRRRA